MLLACGARPEASSSAGAQAAVNAVPEGAKIVRMGAPAVFGDGYRVTVYGVEEVPLPNQRSVGAAPAVEDLADVEVCAGDRPMPPGLVDSGEFEAYALEPFEVDGKKNLVGFSIRAESETLREPEYPEHGKALASGECLRGLLDFQVRPGSRLSAIVYDSTDLRSVPGVDRVRIAWPASLG